MNDNSIIATQAGSLIRQLRDKQARQCRELQSEAEAWRRERLREARRQARAEVRDAVRVARERRRAEIAAAEAQLEAEQRRERQMQLTRVLSRVMERVPDELRRRWRDARTRRVWVEATLRTALDRLGASDWTVRHAPGLEAEERIGDFEQARLNWLEDRDLEAGLVVQKPGARLDASIEGLLASSTELQSRILVWLNRAETGATA